mmetsp:Transcript_53737/g.143786  ORF Transcript_53737/g.143786 Transcript_53737/m.143786 type:complete len:317 (-) Transcript_53737:1538-2488(-)
MLCQDPRVLLDNANVLGGTEDGHLCLGDGHHRAFLFQFLIEEATFSKPTSRSDLDIHIEAGFIACLLRPRHQQAPVHHEHHFLHQLAFLRDDVARKRMHPHVRLSDLGHEGMLCSLEQVELEHSAAEEGQGEFALNGGRETSEEIWRQGHLTLVVELVPQIAFHSTMHLQGYAASRHEERSLCHTILHLIGEGLLGYVGQDRHYSPEKERREQHDRDRVHPCRGSQGVYVTEADRGHRHQDPVLVHDVPLLPIVVRSPLCLISHLCKPPGTCKHVREQGDQEKALQGSHHFVVPHLELGQQGSEPQDPEHLQHSHQ